MAVLPKGTVVVAEFVFSDGTPSKRRPCVVVSDSCVHRRGKVLVCTMSTQEVDRPRPGEVVLLDSHPEHYLTKLTKSSKIDAWSIYSLPVGLLKGKRGSLPGDILQSVLASIREALRI